MISDFRSRTLRGLFWNFVNQIGHQIVMIIVSILLARMLMPRVFGLIGLITVFTGFVAVIGEMGFGAALIQKEKVSDLQLSSVFWVHCAFGLVFMLLFILMSPVMAWFYDEPVLLYLACVLSINFLISSLSIVHMTLLTKQLAFKPIALARIVSSGLAGALAIVMAYRGYGVWCFVAQSLFAVLMLTALLWHLCKWRPKWMFSWSAISEISRFGLNYVGTQAMNYWVRNIDKLLIGRFWGAGSLGIYGLAYRILLFPVTNFANVVGNVLFPALSQVKGDKERVKNIFLKASRCIAIISFPFMLGFFALSENAVIGILGNKWSSIIIIMQIFSIIGMFQSVSSISGSLFLSQGRADLQFRIGLILRLIIVGGIIVGLKWGILGVATGYALTSLASTYPIIYFSGRLVGLTFREFISNLVGVFGVSVSMAAIIWGLNYFMPKEWSCLLRFLIQTPSGVLVYVCLARIVRLKAYNDTLSILHECATLILFKDIDENNDQNKTLHKINNSL